MAEKTAYKTIEEYITGVDVSDEVRGRLRSIHALIQRLAPDAEQRMSWQMPTYWQGENLVHFAAAKHHIGLYPGAEAMVFFQKELAGYKTSKGAVQLPNQQPLPLDLIEKIVRWRVAQAAGKKG